MNGQTNYWITAPGLNDVYAFLRDDAKDAVKDLEDDYVK